MRWKVIAWFLERAIDFKGKDARLVLSLLFGLLFFENGKPTRLAVAIVENFGLSRDMNSPQKQQMEQEVDVLRKR